MYKIKKLTKKKLIIKKYKLTKWKKILFNLKLIKKFNKYKIILNKNTKKLKKFYKII